MKQIRLILAFTIVKYLNVNDVNRVRERNMIKRGPLSLLLTRS